jgi:hypothetical protein
MQVTTPNRPGSGSQKFHRELGDTLGCLLQHDEKTGALKTQNDVLVRQHFMALKLSKAGVLQVLSRLRKR